MNAANDFSHCLQRGKRVEGAVRLMCKRFGWGYQSGYGVVRFIIGGREVPVCVEYRGTPFRKAMEFVGIDSEKALPINVDKIRTKENDLFFFVVDYRPNNSTCGAFTIKKAEVLELMKSHPERIHAYQNRQDPSQSSKSFFVSVDECHQCPKEYWSTLSEFLGD